MNHGVSMAENKKIAQPSLVLLHGWGLNSGVWEGVLPKLREKYNVITPDLPGFGSQTIFPFGYGLSEVIAQLAQEIPDNSIVCGWSLGGLLTIALARSYPEKVRRVLLCAASPCFVTRYGWPGMQPAILQQFADALCSNMSQTIQRFLAIQALGSEHARADIQQLRAAINAYPLPAPDAVQGALRLLVEQDLRVQFAELNQPVSGCFGRLDSLVPAAVIAELKRLQPDARFIQIDKASHAPFISHPGEFLSWLERVLVE